MKEKPRWTGWNRKEKEDYHNFSLHNLFLETIGTEEQHHINT